MLQWDLCIKSLDYEKDCRGVLRTKTKHAGRIPRDAPEKYREVTQLAKGMSRTAQSSMDSDCQSIWLARKQDVFNPGCCWLQCCWFHQICIMLSIQDSTLQHRSMKSHCSLAPLLWMELSAQKSLNSGFNLCRFSTVRGNMELNPTSCIVKLSWVVSHCLCVTSFYLFEERRSKCSLISAGGQPGSTRRRERWWCEGCRCRWLETLEANIRYFSIKMCQRVFDLDLTLMSPPGTLRRCSPQFDGQHGGLKTNRGDRGRSGMRHERPKQ